MQEEERKGWQAECLFRWTRRELIEFEESQAGSIVFGVGCFKANKVVCVRMKASRCGVCGGFWRKRRGRWFVDKVMYVVSGTYKGSRWSANVNVSAYREEFAAPSLCFRVTDLQHFQLSTFNVANKGPQSAIKLCFSLSCCLAAVYLDVTRKGYSQVPVREGGGPRRAAPCVFPLFAERLYSTEM